MTRHDMEKQVFDYFGSANYAGPLLVTINCKVGDQADDCQCPQTIPFMVDGSGEYNLLLELLDVLEDCYNLDFSVDQVR